MKKLRVWGADVPDQRLEPPDRNEPEELDDVKEGIPLSLDLYIKASKDTIDFEVKTKSGLKGDLQWDWARGGHKDGSWASGTYASVTLVDHTGLVEDVGDLLVKFFDAKDIFEGYWHVVAEANLVFELSNITAYDGEVDEEHVESQYLPKQSTLNIKFFESVNSDGDPIHHHEEVEESEDIEADDAEETASLDHEDYLEPDELKSIKSFMSRTGMSVKIGGRTTKPMLTVSNDKGTVATIHIWMTNVEVHNKVNGGEMKYKTLSSALAAVSKIYRNAQ